MSARSSTGTFVWIVLALAAGAGLGFWYGSGRGAPASPAASAAAPEGPPEALVKTAPLAKRTIRETLVAYGPVVASPGESETASVPFECRVRKVLVAEGQTVAKDDPLIEVEPSVDASLELEQAKRTVTSAQGQRDLVKQKVEMKLATRQDLLGAEQTLKEAETKLASLEDRGIDGPRTLNATAAGVVRRIAVEPGQIVPAGDLLLATIGEDRISVQLGIESEDVGHLAAGDAVRLVPVGGPAGTIDTGTIVRVTRRVNPDTRLVDVYVSPAKGIRLLLGEWMRGEVVILAKEALAVPRDAVLPEEGESVLYTVVDAKAVRHVVDVGIESDAMLEVSGDGLAEGDVVVVSGNAELEDGMAIRTGAGR